MSHSSEEPAEERLKIHYGGRVGGRDMTPALGKRGEPASYRRGEEGADVQQAGRDFSDAKWSFLYDKDTGYGRDAHGAEASERIAEASRAARGGEEVPAPVAGPVIKPPVWTWEVPLYFWFGGIATGSAFVALACDAAGDHRSAAVARKLAVGAIVPGAPLLVLDLGRPKRFLYMLRIFKTRSPMSQGVWSLTAFSSLAGTAVAADLLRRPRLARWLGGGAAVTGVHLGSYTGVLLAATAIPVWSRSRLFLPPIFVCTATATGAAATRLVLSATGMPVGHPTRNALGTIETVAMGAELALSSINERRLGRYAKPLEEGRPGLQFKLAKRAVQLGLSLRFARRRGSWVHHVASVLYLLAGLGFRFAWVGSGRTSALDHDSVAQSARSTRHNAGR